MITRIRTTATAVLATAAAGPALPAGTAHAATTCKTGEWTATYYATAPRGSTYFYWVTAVYADGTESAPGGDYAILTP